MLTSICRAYSFYVKTLFQSFLPSSAVMDKDSHHINVLFQRLKTAQQKADLLYGEIKAIRRELKGLAGSGQFLQCTANKQNNVSCNEDETPASKKRKFNFIQDGDYTVVYTDGACENNGYAGARAGLGVWFGSDHPLNIAEPVKGKATNNVGEIQSCIRAIEIAKDNGIKKLKIISDSQYTIKAMTIWIHKWRKNNWKIANKKDDVKNRADFEKLFDLCQKFDVTWEHCAGHSGVEGNEEADRLAREGAKMYKP